jgi:ferritin-like metal-binding protein YciE
MAGTALFPTRNRAQSPFQECFDTLGEVHNEDVCGAIERLVLAGEEVGLTIHDLVRMLKGGMSLEALLDVIEVRMSGGSDPAAVQ